MCDITYHTTCDLHPNNVLAIYSGPDIPCFLNIEKWIIQIIVIINGSTNV